MMAESIEVEINHDDGPERMRQESQRRPLTSIGSKVRGWFRLPRFDQKPENVDEPVDTDSSSSSSASGGYGLLDTEKIVKDNCEDHFVIIYEVQEGAEPKERTTQTQTDPEIQRSFSDSEREIETTIELLPNSRYKHDEQKLDSPVACETLARLKKIERDLFHQPDKLRNASSPLARKKIKERSNRCQQEKADRISAFPTLNWNDQARDKAANEATLKRLDPLSSINASLSFMEIRHRRGPQSRNSTEIDDVDNSFPKSGDIMKSLISSGWGNGFGDQIADLSGPSVNQTITPERRIFDDQIPMKRRITVDIFPWEAKSPPSTFSNNILTTGEQLYSPRCSMDDFCTTEVASENCFPLGFDHHEVVKSVELTQNVASGQVGVSNTLDEPSNLLSDGKRLSVTSQQTTDEAGTETNEWNLGHGALITSSDIDKSSDLGTNSAQGKHAAEQITFADVSPLPEVWSKAFLMLSSFNSALRLKADDTHFELEPPPKAEAFESLCSASPSVDDKVENVVRTTESGRLTTQREKESLESTLQGSTSLAICSQNFSQRETTWTSADAALFTREETNSADQKAEDQFDAELSETGQWPFKPFSDRKEENRDEPKGGNSLAQREKAAWMSLIHEVDDGSQCSNSIIQRPAPSLDENSLMKKGLGAWQNLVKPIDDESLIEPQQETMMERLKALVFGCKGVQGQDEEVGVDFKNSNDEADNYHDKDDKSEDDDDDGDGSDDDADGDVSSACTSKESGTTYDAEEAWMEATLRAGTIPTSRGADRVKKRQDSWLTSLRHGRCFCGMKADDCWDHPFMHKSSLHTNFTSEDIHGSWSDGGQSALSMDSHSTCSIKSGSSYDDPPRRLIQIAKLKISESHEEGSCPGVRDGRAMYLAPGEENAFWRMDSLPSLKEVHSLTERSSSLLSQLIFPPREMQVRKQSSQSPSTGS